MSSYTNKKSTQPYSFPYLFIFCKDKYVPDESVGTALVAVGMLAGPVRFR